MRNVILSAACMAIACTGFAVAPTISGFLPLMASTGMTVTITGTGFTGATLVSFGGTAAASFTVVSSTQITAVVGGGKSGLVQVTTIDGPGSRVGFNYVSTPGIITDFTGYWASSMTAVNNINPDTSHNLLAFTFNGTNYSTGVNDAILSSKGITYTAGNYKALPVAGVTGTNGNTSTFLALALKVDGSATVANTPAVKNYSIRSVMVDGLNGLNLGTGVTNLPATAIMTFSVFNINPTSLTHNEPDIILTQIASPSAGNDIFSFVDISGATVGNTVTQDMTLLPVLGTYGLDLFTLTPNTPYDVARAYSVSAANGTRDIRITGFRLSDFGLTSSNFGLVKAFKITPSGNSDYAFIAYNAGAVNLPPNISQTPTATNVTICSGGTANMAVLASPASGGALVYSWEESINGGSTWSPVTEGGNYSGTTTSKLTVVDATNGYKYRSTVNETGNGNPSVSTVFTIVVSTFTPPTAVTISGGTSLCLNNAAQLTSTVTGGSNLLYQWQSNATGSYVDIPGAVLNSYVPPVNQTGAISYTMRVSSGSGCAGALTSNPATITVTGIASTTPAAGCANSAVTLVATATSGTIDWYAADAGGSSLATATSFTTPVLAASTTYYISSSGCSSALRVPITATIYPASAGGTISGGTSVAPGTNSTTLTLNGVTGTISKWQSSIDTFTTNITDISNTSAQLVANNLTQSTQYRAVIQSGPCAAVFSSVAFIVVNAILPIHNNTVKATKKDNNILIQWTAYDQQNVAQYEVEKSSDGIIFTKVYTALPAKSASASVTYNWLDQQPLTGNNFYRIKEVYLSGNYDYGATVTLLLENGKPGILLHPNPVTGRSIHFQFNEMSAGSYHISFINSYGQVVNQETLIHPGGTQSIILQLPQVITRGLYTVKISGPGGSKSNYSIIIL